MRLVRRILLATSLLPVAACSTPGTATDSAKIASAIGHVKPSINDTCDTQRQVAEQSSRIDTIRTGKETVYKAKCKGPAPHGSAS